MPDQTPSMPPLPEPVAHAAGDWMRAITETELALIPETERRERCRLMYRIPLYTAEQIQAVVADLRKQVHDLNWALGTEGYDKMHDPQDQADHEEACRGTELFLQRMAEAADRRAEIERKAARYDWLRSGTFDRLGLQMPDRGERSIDRTRDRSLMVFKFWCTAEELDAAIDARISTLSLERKDDR